MAQTVAHQGLISNVVIMRGSEAYHPVLMKPVAVRAGDKIRLAYDFDAMTARLIVTRPSLWRRLLAKFRR
jgi:hypothetical protein